MVSEGGLKRLRFLHARWGGNRPGGATMWTPMTTPKVFQFPPALQAVGTRGGAFQAVLSLDDLPVGSMRRVTQGDVDLLIAHTPAGLVATDDRCPHMSAPLSIGRLEDCEITCPLHQGRFDLASGDAVRFPTTGGLDPDGVYHPTWAPPDAPAKPEPSDDKARARALTRVRRLRYYPLRVAGNTVEVAFPE
jgi:nitrite reductase/ring-hydroxylating ferredoxin subunit